jgi:hypothetical protein
VAARRTTSSTERSSPATRTTSPQFSPYASNGTLRTSNNPGSSSGNAHMLSATPGANAESTATRILTSSSSVMDYTMPKSLGDDATGCVDVVADGSGDDIAAASAVGETADAGAETEPVPRYSFAYPMTFVT